MKRLFAFTLSIGLVAAVAVPAAANDVVATHATGDVVRTNSSQVWHTWFDAHAPVDMLKDDVVFKTRPAKGTASGERLDGVGYWTIDVTCAVSLGTDNAGRVGFRFGGPTTESNISRPYIVLEVWDAGSPGASGDTVRTFVEQSLGDACTPTYAGALYDEMLEGNLVVHVAP